MSDTFLKYFEEMVNDHQRDLVSFHYRMVGNKADAEDLAQETFIKAYKKLHTLQDKQKFKGWLFTIARNVAMDFFRKNKDKAIALDENILDYFAKTTAIDSRQEIIRNELSNELKECINSLSGQDQIVVRLLYYEGFSYAEIAELLKVNPNTLKSRLHRARAELLKVFKHRGILQDLNP